MIKGKIITVGLAPAWDLTCLADNIDWFGHVIADNISSQPAGKAMNVSRALAWMGQKTVAAGLWGRDDYEQFKSQLKPLSGYIENQMTVVQGRTRTNVSVLDRASGKEMHLRSLNCLISRQGLAKLRFSLERLVRRGDWCVFSGSLPDDELLGDIIDLISYCSHRGASVAVDTSGTALARAVHSGCASLIKPNIDEFGHIFGRSIPDQPRQLCKKAKELATEVPMIALTRGSAGAMLVNGQSCQVAKTSRQRQVVSTVGCGDYFLAGFLYGLTAGGDAAEALKCGIQAGTAKAWQITETATWQQAQEQIPVEVEPAD